MSNYAHHAKVDLPFDLVVSQTHAALKREEFGVMAEIDVQKAMHAKLGKDIHPYLILGACLPPLAFRAITTEPLIGVLIPCNVCVWDNGDGTSTIAAINAVELFQLVQRPELAEVAKIVNAKLEAVIDRVRTTTVG